MDRCGKLPTLQWVALWLTCVPWAIGAPSADAFEQKMQEANRMRQSGNYPEAERLYAESLRDAETYGEHDLRLAKSLNNLAVLYHLQGRYADAEPLYKRAYSIWERVLGNDDDRVATCLNNLGDLYRQLRSEEHSVNSSHLVI